MCSKSCEDFTAIENVWPIFKHSFQTNVFLYLGLVFTSARSFLFLSKGAECWAQQLGQSIPLFSWVPFVNAIQTSRAVLYMMIAFAVIPTVAFNVSNVHRVVQSRKRSMVCIISSFFLEEFRYGISYLSPINLIATYPHLVVLVTGLAFGFLVGRMILAHLCDEPKGLKTIDISLANFSTYWFWQNVIS